MAGAYRLTEEHEDFRRVVAEFADKRLAPYVADWNSRGGLPLEAVRQMGDLGLFGLGGPEEYGGAGDFTSLCIAIEEIGRVDQSLGITLEAGAGARGEPDRPLRYAGAEGSAGCPICWPGEPWRRSG